jgi:hypothetical protein
MSSVGESEEDGGGEADEADSTCWAGVIGQVG